MSTRVNALRPKGYGPYVSAALALSILGPAGLKPSVETVLGFALLIGAIWLGVRTGWKADRISAVILPITLIVAPSIFWVCGSLGLESAETSRTLATFLMLAITAGLLTGSLSTPFVPGALLDRISVKTMAVIAIFYTGLCVLMLLSMDSIASGTIEFLLDR